jgi:hypothetical protein
VGRGQLHNLLLADGESRVDLVASFLRQGSEERYLVRLAQRRGARRGRDGGQHISPGGAARRAGRGPAAGRWTGVSRPSTRASCPWRSCWRGPGAGPARGSLAGAQQRGPERAALESPRAPERQALLIDADARGWERRSRWRCPPAASRSPTAPAVCAVHPRYRRRVSRSIRWPPSCRAPSSRSRSASAACRSRSWCASPRISSRPCASRRRWMSPGQPRFRCGVTGSQPAVAVRQVAAFQYRRRQRGALKE